MSAHDVADTLVLRGPDGETRRFLRVPEAAFSGPPWSPVLAPGEGLAYVFAGPRRVAFWTLGFEHAVDQVYVAANGRVLQVFEARPAGDETLTGPACDVLLVLELAAGEARRLGILPGVVLADVDGRVFDASADPGFIAIVQSDRAGWFLACELRRRGYRIAHVHHTRHLEEVSEAEFDVELIYGDDLDEVLPRLSELGPSLVLAGSELGVNPADYLAECLLLPGNGTLLSVARRDKAGMIEALHKAGIPVMRQLRSCSWKRIVRWMQRHRLPEIVIKPARSAGTDRVACARTPAEVKRAVRAIVGATNRLGLAEVEVVAQERLFGPEIYLNCVSRAGQHAVTEIWLETKRAAHAADGSVAAPFSYDTFELLPGDDVLAGYLREWLARVLDALGLAWGPSHSELILTPAGPRLIDFGARLDGVLLPGLNEECIGRSPVQLTADAYLDVPGWQAWAARPYRLLQHAMMVVVDNPCAGIVRDDSGLRGIARLPTFHALRPRWGIGDAVPATRDAFSYNAIITLRDPDAAAVRADFATIRMLEAAHLLLDVVPSAPAIDDEVRVSFEDPRALDAWGDALAAFGWTTVRDEPTGLVARARTDLDGLMLWVPRQTGTLELAALERLRVTTGAHRVIVELVPGTRVVPLVGADIEVASWDVEVEVVCDAEGLTPTMHAQAPALIELASPSQADIAGLAGGPDVAITSLAELDAAAIESTFRALGAGETARWPAALGASFAHTGRGALAVIGERAAALGILHAGAVHVPVASALDRVDLRRLALGLGAHFGAAVIAPGTGVASTPGGVRGDLPPALRWKRPAWAQYLVDLEGIHDAVGLPPSAAVPPSPASVNPELVARFAAREHPLATWGGAAIGQMLGRVPLWSRTAMLFREVPGDSQHAVVPHATCIDLGAFAALADKYKLLWIGWEPPPAGGDVIAADGSLHRLRWHDPARALHQAAALGLYPVRARWTHRKTFVLDLAGDEAAVLDRLDPGGHTALRDALHAPDASFPRIAIAPITELTPSDWRRLDAIDDAQLATEPESAGSPRPRRIARGLALGLGPGVVCALAEDAAGLVAYSICLLHDRVAWSMLGATHPRAAHEDPQPLMRWHLVRHARAAGCDLLDLYGAWDERYPHEHPAARSNSLQHERLAVSPVYYPPTLARFGS